MEVGLRAIISKGYSKLKSNITVIDSVFNYDIDTGQVFSDTRVALGAGILKMFIEFLLILFSVKQFIKSSYINDFNIGY